MSQPGADLSDPQEAARRRRPPLVTRVQAVQAAYELIAAEGPEGLSMRKLAGALHVSLPTVYTAISSKETLIGELQERLIGEIAQGLVAVASSSGDAGSRLGDLIGATLSWAALNPNLADFLVAERLPADLAGRAGATTDEQVRNAASRAATDLFGDLGGYEPMAALAFVFGQMRAAMTLSRDPLLAGTPIASWRDAFTASIVAGLHELDH